MDVRLLKPLPAPVQGILCAPPCEHLASAGASWWRTKGEEALLEGLATVDACLRAVVVHQPQWWVLENPVGRLSHYLGKAVMIFHPWQYGDPWTKRTCLWGEFTVPTPSPVEPVDNRLITNMPGTKDRQQRRAITPPGFARAFFEANP